MVDARIQLVCFDLGGVLLRHCATWRESCERAGVVPSARFDDPEIWRSLEDTHNAWEKGRISQDIFVDAVRRASECYEAREVEAVIGAWLIELNDDVERVVDEVHRAGRRTALLTNTNLAHWRQIQSERAWRSLIERFDRVHASHEMGARKPEANAYLNVERTAQVQPQSILYFDDVHEYLDGAYQRGWVTEWIDPTRPTADQLREALRRHGVL